MSSDNPSTKPWKIAAALAVILLAVSVCLGVGRTQEPVQPQIDEEFAKQEKIYQRRGENVPGSYITNRGLSGYAEVLPSGFCEALGRLGSSDRWLDIGAGEGQAIIDYHAPQDPAGPAPACGGSGPRAHAVAISIEDRRTEKWKRRAARVGDDRMKYLVGKRLRQHPREELGTFRMITDVYGGFTYSENLSRFVERVLSLLEVGGAFYTVLPSVHLEDGSHKLGTWFLTEVVDAASRPVTVCSWLKQTGCAKVTCETKRNWDAPTQLIKVEKVCSGVTVPALRVVEYMAGAPPGRRFQIEP